VGRVGVYGVERTHERAAIPEACMSSFFDITFDMMKAIQIVVDEDLLRRVDRSARRLKSSRSAAVRRLLEAGLESEALAALARAESKAYARVPESKEESAAFRSLAKSQRRVLDDLARTDQW